MSVLSCEPPVALIEPPKRSPGYVLEVEDQPESSLLDDKDYEDVGASRVPAPSPEEARLEIVKLGPLQDQELNNVLILLDLMFEPDNKIDRACALLSEVRAGKSDVHYLTPIIVLTNNTAPDTKRRVLEAGANHFLSKTADPAELVDLIRFYLGVETIVEQRVLEVEHIDYEAAEVMAVIRGSDEWEAVTHIPLAQCPWSARVPGGSFLLERIRRFRDFQPESLLRARLGSAREEGEELLRELE